jgi:hypothetical protein
MAIYEFVLPEGSPDPCPMACGGLTEDAAGGPCKACWAKVPGPQDEPEDECPSGCVGGCECGDESEDDDLCCGDPDCFCAEEPIPYRLVETVTVAGGVL